MELNFQFERQFRKGPKISAEWRIQFGLQLVTVILGTSGCGKSTLLRCLAGLDRPSQGYIKFGSEVWFEEKSQTFLYPQERRIGFVTQECGLFPQLTVKDNLLYGIGELSREEAHRRIEEVAGLLNVRNFYKRYPSELSGGQKQRVAIARTLATRPRLLLLDEPFSSLDSWTKKDLRPMLKDLLTVLSLPTLWVTHDEDEAKEIADQVLVMKK